MKIAVMQPYFFPYLGYFQLINSVDKFIFYDDVNYIKGGWINRNNILVQNSKKLFTLNLRGASPNKTINEVFIGNNGSKILKTIQQSYAKAPYFSSVIQIVEDVFRMCHQDQKISKIAATSVVHVSDYLELDVEFEFSSEIYGSTKGQDRSDRLINICKKNNAGEYVNPLAGSELYTKEYFRTQGVELLFLKHNLVEYKQFNEVFVPFLSIIDVLMFNKPDDIREMLNSYELV